MNPIFKCKIDKGKIILNETCKKRYDNFIKSLFDGDYEIIIRKLRRDRSLRQNNYYWGVVLELISQHNGDFVYDLHEIFLELFAPKIEDNIGTYKVLLPLRSKKMSTKQFTDYIEKIRMFAKMELGIDIPEPKEVDYDEEEF